MAEQKPRKKQYVDPDFYKEVNQIIIGNGSPIEIEKLVAKLKNKMGLSHMAIRKKLDNLRPETLIDVPIEERISYGIHDADGRRKYVTLKSIADSRTSVEKIINFIKKDKDSGYLKADLYELDNYLKRGVILNGDNINTLAEKLIIDDEDLRIRLSEILFNQIHDRGIDPSNLSSFLSKIKPLLSKYSTAEIFNAEKNSCLPSLISLLCIYKDPKIIERIKEDFKKCTPGILRSISQTWYGQEWAAKVIEENISDLFEFARKLQIEGKTESAVILDAMKYKAIEIVDSRSFCEKCLLRYYK